MKPKIPAIPNGDLAIRAATPADTAAVAALTEAAYARYVPRIGRKPMPMLDDHAARIGRGEVFVLDLDGRVAGLISLVAEPDALLIYSVAVAPEHQGSGYGRTLMAFAETAALERGVPALRLYTNVKMTENQAIYRRLGFVETHRAEEHGLNRVFMEKRFG